MKRKFKFAGRTRNNAVESGESLSSGKKFDSSIFKGILFSVLMSLVLILIFALIIKVSNLPETFIKPINQVIKVISIFVGVFVAVRKNREAALFKGLFIGLVYIVVSFLVFSALDKSFNLGWSILNDLLFGGIAGAISGVLFKIKNK